MREPAANLRELYGIVVVSLFYLQKKISICGKLYYYDRNKVELNDVYNIDTDFYVANLKQYIYILTHYKMMLLFLKVD